MVGKCDIGLWRTRGEHKSLVGEFAFQVQFARREEVAEKQKKLAAQFYISLQHDVAGLAGAGRHQDRHGVPPEWQRAAKP